MQRMILSLLVAQAVSFTPSPLASTMSPLDMYRQAIKTMHSITAPMYLAYDVRIRTTHKGRNVVQHFDEFANVEKTIDRTGRLHVSGDAKTFKSFVRVHPDLFLGRSPGPTSSQALTIQSEADKPLKTIGSEDLPQCSSAIHLALTPRSDPLRYNLRDVWINPTTSRLCRATALWRDPVEFAVQVSTVFLVTLDMDADGFVDHWSTTGVAKFLGLPYAITQDWSYSNIRAATETALETLGTTPP